MSSLTVLSNFKTTLIDFLDDLNELFPNDADIIMMRIAFNDQYPIVDLMNNFVQYLLPHKEKARKKDDAFFMNNKNLFTSLKPGTVAKFKKYWRSDYMDAEDREAIWKWVALFYKIAEDYVKAK